MRVRLVVVSGIVGLLVSGCAPRTSPTTQDLAPDGGPTAGCSEDLQSTIDQDGVIHACASDELCSEGECRPACDAAADRQSQLGCVFDVPTPKFYSTSVGCHALFVVNGGPRPISLTLTRGGEAIDAAPYSRIAGVGDTASWAAMSPDGLPSGEVAVVFLSHAGDGGYDCPVPPASVETVVSDRPAWHLETSLPVTLYDILPYGGATSYLPSASLLWPTASWGDQYLVAAPLSTGGPGFASGMPWLQLVAGDAPVSAVIRPTVELTGAPMGVETTIDLTPHETRLLLASGDVSGSLVTSASPVGVFAGNDYLCVSSATAPSGGGCDSAHLELPPVSAWGTEYVAAPFETRRADLLPESIGYQVVAATDGTVLEFDPPIAGATTSLVAGQSVRFEADVPFVVRSQDADHPIYLSQTMSGCLLNGGTRPGDSESFGSACLGDEDYVGLPPPDQFLRSYVFFSDPTYGTTNLTITRRAEGGVFSPVEVTCLGEVGGWKPVGSDGLFETTTVDLVRAAVGVGTCGNGRQTARSAGRFGVVVWGLDNAASYAYPAGGTLTQLNDVNVD